MTRRRACWLAARHIALWPWPSRHEPPLPAGHPWLAGLAWLRGGHRWLAIAVAWLGLALASGGVLLHLPLIRETPAAASPAAGRASAAARGAAGAHLHPGGAR